MEQKLGKNQQFFIVTLRVLIGWHLLYEGVAKLYNPSWTAKGYLLSAEGPFGAIFTYMAKSDFLLQLIDVVNVWGLMLAGLALILGLFDKYAAILGALLTFSYYLAHPPLVGTESVPGEGNVIFVNKNLIEAVALGLLSVFPSGHIIGLNRFIVWRRKKMVLDN
ncbi:MAG TPA: DoxX subfamily [Cytophagales bacterium]|jgi:thiosulfate dehydrogenase [quinone] large subunit|nr:DoxX subfamily [Cytophagales bacterium]